MSNLRMESLGMVKDYLEGLKFTDIITQSELSRLHEVINELEDIREQNMRLEASYTL